MLCLKFPKPMSWKEHDACIMIHRCVKSTQVIKLVFPPRRIKLTLKLAEFGENQRIKVKDSTFLGHSPHWRRVRIGFSWKFGSTRGLEAQILFPTLANKTCASVGLYSLTGIDLPWGHRYCFTKTFLYIHSYVIRWSYLIMMLWPADFTNIKSL